jgi:hypothetical protein
LAGKREDGAFGRTLMGVDVPFKYSMEMAVELIVR